MFIIDVDDLRRQKRAFNSKFEQRMKEFNKGDGTTKKPWRIKFPLQQYACCCPTMRTYQGDICSSTCKDCFENGTAISNCRTCKCQCQTGIFVENDIITMATAKLRRDELEECKQVPDKNDCVDKNFAQVLSSLVQKGFESLLNSKSRLNEKNVLYAAAGHMSRLQMPSKEELHSLQQNLPLTTRLRASGANVCHALNADPRKKGKRHHWNGLR
jgi:hypothetical protein